MEKQIPGMPRLSHALKSVSTRETTARSTHQHTLACRVEGFEFSFWTMLPYGVCSASPAIPLGGCVLNVYFPKHNFQVTESQRPVLKTGIASWLSSLLFKLLPPTPPTLGSSQIKFWKSGQDVPLHCLSFSVQNDSVPTLAFWPKGRRGRDAKVLRSWLELSRCLVSERPRGRHTVWLGMPAACSDKAQG